MGSQKPCPRLGPVLSQGRRPLQSEDASIQNVSKWKLFHPRWLNILSPRASQKLSLVRFESSRHPGIDFEGPEVEFLKCFFKHVSSLELPLRESRYSEINFTCSRDFWMVGDRWLSQGGGPCLATQVVGGSPRSLLSDALKELAKRMCKL